MRLVIRQEAWNQLINGRHILGRNLETGFTLDFIPDNEYGL